MPIIRGALSLWLEQVDENGLSQHVTLSYKEMLLDASVLFTKRSYGENALFAVEGDTNKYSSLPGTNCCLVLQVLLFYLAFW